MFKELFVSACHWVFSRQFGETQVVFFVVNEGCGDAFSGKLLPAHLCPMWSHVTDFKELGLVYVASGSLGAVFVNLLSAFLRPSRLDALARNSQVSQGDVSHELFVFASKWAF